MHFAGEFWLIEKGRCWTELGFSCLIRDSSLYLKLTDKESESQLRLSVPLLLLLFLLIFAALISYHSACLCITTDGFDTASFRLICLSSSIQSLPQSSDIQIRQYVFISPEDSVLVVNVPVKSCCCAATLCTVGNVGREQEARRCMQNRAGETEIRLRKG